MAIAATCRLYAIWHGRSVQRHLRQIDKLQTCKLRYGVVMSSDDLVMFAESPGPLLRRLRVQVGRSVREVSSALGWSTSKVSRIETSASQVRPDDLARLLDYYDAADEVRRQLVALAQKPLGRSRRSTVAVPDPYERYIKLESQAERISLYGAVVIPGLLQTPEYAAVVIKAIVVADDQFVQTRMEARMIRQAILGRQPPLQLSVVIDEAALRRPIGGHDVMRRQMIRLQELNDRPEIIIRVLPFDVGAHAALTGPFAILDFPKSAGIPSQVFCDGLTGGVLRTKTDEVDQYRTGFLALEELAQSKTDSTKTFSALATSAAG
jgi:transcriptional regulator with XRE-family HTH domain